MDVGAVERTIASGMSGKGAKQAENTARDHHRNDNRPGHHRVHFEVMEFTIEAPPGSQLQMLRAGWP